MEEKMALPGKSAFHGLRSFRSTKWFTKDFITFASQIASKYQGRSEVLFGGLLSTGTTSGTALPVTIQAGELKAAGKHHPFSTISGQDQFSAGLIIYSNGDPAEGVTLTGAVGNYISIILCNSNGAGGVAAEGAVPIVVAIINGTTAGTAATSEAPLSSEAIQTALEGSTGVHDGVTGWAHIGYVHTNVVNNLETTVSNINNHLGL